MSEPGIEITDDMHEIVRRAILSFVATVNEDGSPNLSPKASLTVRGNALFFANIASPDLSATCGATRLWNSTWSMSSRVAVTDLPDAGCCCRKPIQTFKRSPLG
jgi:hypothetical protein